MRNRVGGWLRTVNKRARQGNRHTYAKEMISMIDRTFGSSYRRKGQRNRYQRFTSIFVYTSNLLREGY